MTIPRYIEKTPQFIAIQFTGDNLHDLKQEFGPRIDVPDLPEGKVYDAVTVYSGANQPTIVRKGEFLVLQEGADVLRSFPGEAFHILFEPLKKVGRPKKNEG